MGYKKFNWVLYRSIKRKSPLTLRYACGKHEFDEVKKKRYMENE